MSFLSVNGIRKCYDKQTALNNVSIAVEKGELVCILGPSGCGKTTLLRIIAGLETADSGSVFIGGKDCTFIPPSKRNFGIVFQSYALFPNMTVEQNILFGLNQRKNMDKLKRMEKVNEVLELVDLKEHRTKYPMQLSGGQQQRTALARAIALSPDYLLLDEPLSALDAKVRAKLRGEICRIQRTLGITTIMVTHDQEEALTMADRIIVMNNAVIEQVGTPKEIYEHPSSPFVANFIGTMNFYQKDNLLYGIRPENVTIQKENCRSDSNCCDATISLVEFRGALTRIYGIMTADNLMCVDIPSERAAELGLKAEDKAFFRLSEQHLMRYNAAEVYHV